VGSTFTNLLFHLIFSTKDRAPLITEGFQERLYSYIGGLVRDEGGALLAAGGMPDHVHLLACFKADTSVSDMVRRIKANSSKWVHQGIAARHFAWQTGYGAFSVSESQKESVKRYIQDQPQHHARLSFREELIALLERHQIAYDERYLLG
jgi:putative transposase